MFLLNRLPVVERRRSARRQHRRPVLGHEGARDVAMYTRFPLPLHKVSVIRDTCCVITYKDGNNWTESISAFTKQLITDTSYEVSIKSQFHGGPDERFCLYDYVIRLHLTSGPKLRSRRRVPSTSAERGSWDAAFRAPSVPPRSRPLWRS